MNKLQVERFFKDKDQHSPITDQLIIDGYKQKSGGYIRKAKEQNIDNPSQYWHLIQSWCESSQDNAIFNKRIQCGELIFWMAEVSGAVDEKALKELADIIVKCYLSDRRKGNRIIQEICFDKIVSVVENS